MELRKYGLGSKLKNHQRVLVQKRVFELRVFALYVSGFSSHPSWIGLIIHVLDRGVLYPNSYTGGN